MPHLRRSGRPTLALLLGTALGVSGCDELRNRIEETFDEVGGRRSVAPLAMGGSAPTAGGDGDEQTPLSPVITADPLAGIDPLRLAANEMSGRPLILAPLQASAGGDQTVTEQQVVTLQGESSGAAADVRYQWRQISGEPLPLAVTDSAILQFTAPLTTTPLTFSFELQVSDSAGRRAADQMQVVVEPINAHPRADAGRDRVVEERSSVALSGGDSHDSDGDIVSYLWQQIDGPAVVLVSSASEATCFTAPKMTTPTTLTFQLQVTDNEGATAHDTVQVSIRPINSSPHAVASALHRRVEPGDEVVLNGAASSDSDGQIVSYRWQQVGGPAVVLREQDAVTLRFIAPELVPEKVESSPMISRFFGFVDESEAHTVATTEAAAEHAHHPHDAARLNFMLTVTDNEGASASDHVTVEIPYQGQGPLHLLGEFFSDLW